VEHEAMLRSASRAGARLAKAVDLALADVNLSLPQYRLLAFLSGAPERATALARCLEVSPPSLTALVDGAVARGLVERVSVADDRRCVHHRMTPVGQRALAEGDAAIAARLEAIAAALTPSQARTALEGLQLLGQALEAVRRPPAAAR
jgi:long-chain acyl-CoA synthetase